MRTLVLIVASVLVAQRCEAWSFSELKAEAGETLGELSSVMKLSHQYMEMARTAKNLKLRRSGTSWGPLAIDLDACENITSTLMEGEQVVVDIVNQGYGVYDTISGSIDNLLNCKPGFNMVKYIECIKDNISAIKQAMDSIKPFIAESKQHLQQLYQELHTELIECIGISQ